MRFALSIFLLLHYYLGAGKACSDSDAAALLAFRAASDASNSLASWNATTADCCQWYGVSCLRDRVSRLVLQGLGLRGGGMGPLASLPHLRVLSLSQNGLTGPVPDLSTLIALKLLFLSRNGFSGDFPASLPSLSRLYRLDLSHNNFSGQIPAKVNLLTHLLTLRLEGNRFGGVIPDLKNLSKLQDFNVSRNRLAGEIPKPLSVFPATAFYGNPALCGSPLSACKPRSDGAMASPVLPGGGWKKRPPVVVSSPAAHDSTERPHRAAKIGSLAVVVIIVVGDVLVLALVSLVLYCYFWRNASSSAAGGGKAARRPVEGEKMVYSSSPYPAAARPGFEGPGRMVFFEGARRFELEDLLRASAEMLGKGGFGTAYKAVLDDGGVVAVKRLRDAQVGGIGKRDFDQHMEVLGRLRHPNVVSLLAYYFATEEKLLVYDFIPNGSLFWLLHGNRGPGRTPLDWTTRLRIAAGAARGVAFIHGAFASFKLTHGNIKSTNVLLDSGGDARLSDTGLSVFAPSAGRFTGYLAPEEATGRKRSHEAADVYAFGVLLLELLTGKCPSVVDGGGAAASGLDLPRWVQSVVREEWTAEVFDLELMRYKDIEEEMVGLLQIAMACTSSAPDQRPKMSHVAKMIEEIRGGAAAVSPSPSPSPQEPYDSVSDSPSVSDRGDSAS